MVTTTDCTSGCASRSAATTSTPEPSGRPRSISARLNLTALTRPSASCTRAASWICEFGNTWLISALSHERISGRSSSSRMLFMRCTPGGSGRRPDVSECWPRRSQRQREPYHGAVTRAGFDQALALHLLGAVLHAGHAVAAVELAVELHRYALAVVLHGQAELPVGDRAAHLAMRRAAVLDDVAHRLAQDARGLH